MYGDQGSVSRVPVLRECLAVQNHRQKTGTGMVYEESCAQGCTMGNIKVKYQRLL